MRARFRTPGLSDGGMAGPAGAGDASDLEQTLITLAPIATVLGLAFKLSDPENCWVAQKI